MKKFNLTYEPELEYIEEKIKDVIREPFIKMQTFYKIYGTVTGEKINVEECMSKFPKFFEAFDEFLLWSFYTPITLHAILGKFSFYLKDEQSYYEDLVQSIVKTVN